MDDRRIRRWLRGEAEKLRPLNWRQRVDYVWDYYKLWILGGLAVIVFVATFAVQVSAAGRGDWFNACFANTYAEIGNGSSFWRDFADYAGYDLREKNLSFNARVYCDPTRQEYSNQYYRALIALMDSGTLDALVMEPERLTAMGAAGRLMDLEDTRTAEIFRRYGDRLVYCTPLDDSYGKDRVAVGIDLTGTALEAEAYPNDGAALGVNALSPHPDQAAVFLAFLFADGEA